MRVIFLGTPEIAVPTLRALAASHDVLAVFTQPAARRSRGGKAEPSPVGQAAAALGIECHEVESVSAGQAPARMQALKPDVIVVVAFGQMLKRAVLELPRHGCLNFHPSALPRYRGAAPVQRAVLEGVTDSGLTIMRLVKKMDAGPILLQKPWRLNPDKNAQELLTEAGLAGAPMMLEALARLDTGLTAREQDESQVTFAPPLTKADGELMFSQRATELHNRIRAVQPWPKAEAWLERDPKLRVIVQRSAVEAGSGEPGTIQGISQDGIRVACGDGVLRLLELQLEGKPPRPARDVANGLRLKTGERFRV